MHSSASNKAFQGIPPVLSLLLLLAVMGGSAYFAAEMALAPNWSPTFLLPGTLFGLFSVLTVWHRVGFSLFVLVWFTLLWWGAVVCTIWTYGMAGPVVGALMAWLTGLTLFSGKTPGRFSQWVFALTGLLLSLVAYLGISMGTGTSKMTFILHTVPWQFGIGVLIILQAGLSKKPES